MEVPNWVGNYIAMCKGWGLSTLCGAKVYLLIENKDKLWVASGIS
jgi:hypothetical protein